NPVSTKKYKKLAGRGGGRLWSQLLGRLRRENGVNPGGGACSELRSGHCTPAWATERDSVSKKKKKKKKKENACSLGVLRLWLPLWRRWPHHALIFTHHLEQKPGPLFFFFFFFGRVSLCGPGWSAVAGSQLTASSASLVHAILLPQPPE
uniref:Uncharacterized protein n=1 Tax=Macaca fascicularis TaxID=9541 RepID=A0A7N9CE76_MACFA